MIIYYSTPYRISKVLDELQAVRTSNKLGANFLSCPAFKNNLNNLYAVYPHEDSIVSFDKDNAVSSVNNLVTKFRNPSLKNTTLFNLGYESIFFAEEPTEMKVTAPYFHKAIYTVNASFLGGVFDIGKWCRPVISEIVTWEEEGQVTFKKDEPLFYVQFNTAEKIELVRFVRTPTFYALVGGLVQSPLSKPKNFQGSLQTRYDGFEQSNYRFALIEEIKASLVSEDSASPSV